MTLEQIIIASARVAGSLPVLRWAFVGALLAILVDFSDLFMMNLIDLGGLGDYQTFDKWADQGYMLTFLWVAVRQWDGPDKTIAIWLFAFRAVGFSIFALTEARWVLLVFPNVFEFWFVGIAAQRHWIPGYEFTAKRIFVWLITCAALKSVQEHTLHVWQVLDDYVAVEVVITWWEFLKGLL